LKIKYIKNINFDKIIVCDDFVTSKARKVLLKKNIYFLNFARIVDCYVNGMYKWRMYTSV